MAYWVQVTVMAKKEQKEYRRLVTVEEDFRIKEKLFMICQCIGCSNGCRKSQGLYPSDATLMLLMQRHFPEASLQLHA